MKGITVLIPAYNEQNRLPRTLREIEDFMRVHKGRIKKVMIVDDGSSDKTVERALYFRDRLPLDVQVLTVNGGKWGAIQYGINRIKKGPVLLLDADGSASIFELEEFDEVGEGYAVFGSRFSEDSNVEGRTLLRDILSHGYRHYVRLCYYYLGGGISRIEDMQCPWKFFYAEDFRGSMKTKGFAGDIEFALRLDGHILSWPVDFRHEGGGVVGLKTVWNMLVRTPVVAWRVRREKKRNYYV